eukprot:5465068-Alexandrium_andersonii.AAC.1
MKRAHTHTRTHRTHAHTDTHTRALFPREREPNSARQQLRCRAPICTARHARQVGVEGHAAGDGAADPNVATAGRESCSRTPGPREET